MEQKESLILNRFPNNSEIASQKAAQKLVSLVDESLNKNIPVLLLLSGGTWIPALEKADSSVLIANKNLNQLTITTLDERAEPGPDNNYQKLIATPLISSLLKSGAKTISTLPQEKESPHSLGERIDEHLKDYFQKNPSALLIATAGVGGESNVPGHTAGIEPREKNDFEFLFQNPDIFYQGYIAKSLEPKLRATATFTLLDRVNHFVLLILNPEEKRRSLNNILSENPLPLNESPCIYFRHRPNTAIFTDISTQ